jgi:UDP-N-acetylglucosamine 4-epimerase
MTIPHYTQEERGPLKKVVVTGAAGFIGSHLVEALLKQRATYVVAVDNLWTGNTRNLQQALSNGGPDAESRLEFHEKDVRDFNAYNDCSVVFHLAALGSVPRSIERPLQTHQANVEGFFNSLNRARKCGVKRFVYASSSSVYGDSEDSVQSLKHRLGTPLSPYAATKVINETYAQAFNRSFGMEAVGLRFFNVYGPRQNPEGEYAAVIPRWISAIRANKPIQLFGDGLRSRDFTYVSDVVDACLLAGAAHENFIKLCSIYNVGTGLTTHLLELKNLIVSLTGCPALIDHLPERIGDKRETCADITETQYCLGYKPKVSLKEGLAKTIEYYT